MPAKAAITPTLFPARRPTLTMYTAIAEIDHPERLLPIGWRRTSGGMFAYGPFPDRFSCRTSAARPMTGGLPSGVRRSKPSCAASADVAVKALKSASRWTDNTRLVETDRRGRVLLAGDAAHIHSPFGGQDMSLGLVDAQNLGWKLAAIGRGDMPDSLLDTDTAERRPPPKPFWPTPSPRWPSCGPIRKRARCGTSWRS